VKISFPYFRNIVLFILNILFFPFPPLLNSQTPTFDKIVFSREESANDWDIWTMDLNGSNQTRIHNSTSNDGDPHFRSDGSKIVFSRFTQALPPTADICVIDPDGNNLVNLTSDIPAECGRPKWSWNGIKIVYKVSAGPDNGDIFLMNADGTSKTALITGSTNDEWPSFSPDSLYIVLQRYVGAISNQKSKIIRYKISDGTITELTDGNYLDEMPVYSPDGNYVLFKRGTTNPEIFRIRIDNLALENLTNNSVVDDAPAYSYDGTKIAWMQSTSALNTCEIWIMNSGGSGKTQLTSNSVADFNPTFSPFSTTSGPEINIKGNNITIINGSATPSTLDYTDFSSVLVDSGAITRTFAIENLGTANLILSGSPLVQLTGTNSTDFSVLVNPSSTIAASSNTTFQVRFDPSASGTRTATISIPNNDSDENPYTLAIQGSGTASAAAVYGKIAFCKQQSTTDWDIWIMDADGSNQTKLLDSDAKDMNPHFSPAGKYIAFSRTSGSSPNFTNDVYIMNSDGTNATNLTSDVSESCVGPKFAWNESRLAFFRNYMGSGFVLCTMNLDGTNKQYINDQAGNPVVGDSPFFTPDGQWVVFQRVNPDQLKGAIYKVPAAGGNVIQLTNTSDFYELPRVSPDGQFVICKYNPIASGKADIAKFSINQTPPTSNVANLTNTMNEDEDSPMYSYEGDRIAYMGTAGTTSMEIWTMNPDGSVRTRLTNNSQQDFDPTFSPASAVPGQVTLLSPSNGSINQPTTLTLTWNAVSRATTYHIQLSVDSSFTSLAVDDTNITSTSRQLTSLENNKTYFWRVRAKNTAGWGLYSSTWNFTTIISVPSVPTLTSPTNGAIGISITPTLSWFASTGAATYHLQVALDSMFTSVVYNDSTLTTISKQVGPLLNNTKYYWRVNAKNTGGTSAWSAVWNFTTLTTHVEKDNNVIPTEYELAQNYPNPFNSRTTIQFDIPQMGNVNIKIFNALGKEISVLIDGFLPAGRYRLNWEAKNLPSGVYFYELIAGNFREVKKMIVSK